MHMQGLDGTLLVLHISLIIPRLDSETCVCICECRGHGKPWRQLVEAGKVHSLGVSNFDVDKLESLMDFAKIRPVINQVELNPNRRDSELLRLCRDLVSPCDPSLVWVLKIREDIEQDLEHAWPCYHLMMFHLGAM